MPLRGAFSRVQRVGFLAGALPFNDAGPPWPSRSLDINRTEYGDDAGGSMGLAGSREKASSLAVLGSTFLKLRKGAAALVPSTALELRDLRDL